MDLPVPVSKDCPTRSSRDSLDIESEDLTSAERFAAPNQCTLKKNERFSSDSFESKKEVKLDYKGVDKPKAEVKPQENSLNTESIDDSQRSSTDRNKLDDVLHIEEEPSKELHKSPIPARNTKKFVTQFADLHLTGGCLSSTESPPTQTSNVPPPGQQTLSSFKPQVKVKPQLMKKPLVLPPTTPEMSRRNHD